MAIHDRQAGSPQCFWLHDFSKGHTQQWLQWLATTPANQYCSLKILCKGIQQNNKQKQNTNNQSIQLIPGF
jgi:hypothetical protein